MGFAVAVVALVGVLIVVVGFCLRYFVFPVLIVIVVVVVVVLFLIEGHSFLVVRV